MILTKHINHPISKYKNISNSCGIKQFSVRLLPCLPNEIYYYNLLEFFIRMRGNYFSSRMKHLAFNRALSDKISIQ